VVRLDDIGRFAVAFPEVEEVTHFRLPSFKVKGKPFAGVEKGGATAVFSVSEEEAAQAVADDPAIYEEVWRTAATKTFVGLRVASPRSRGSASRSSSSTPGGTRHPNDWWSPTTPNDRRST
jgi:hypothetical protein